MSFVHRIFEGCQAAGSRPVLYEVQGPELVATSGRQLLSDVARARGFLRAAGVAPGDRVGLLAPNGARWVAVDLAIMAEGAICVPLYTRQAPTQLAAMMRDCGPRLLLTADDALSLALAESWPEHGRIATYAEAFASEPLTGPPAEVATDTPATIIYTSGTSGEPKGAMLSYANIDHMLGVTVRELGKMSRARHTEDRVFQYLPFCFAGSRIMLLSQLVRGNSLMMSTDLERLQQELQVAAPHYCLNVPALLERIRSAVIQRLRETGGPLFAVYERAVAAHALQSDGRGGLVDRAFLALAQRVLFPRVRRSIGANLEFLVCGSAPLGEATQRWFEMIGIPVYQVYGLTETTAIATIDDTTRVVPGRVGHAIEGCEITLGPEGELLCRGPNVFLGYWNRPQASAEALRDGWLHTGDQAEIDGRGNVKVIGRVKEVLVPESGHNVPPAPLEQRLVEASARVQQALVVGHGRPFLTAIVTGDADPHELDRVRDEVNAQLPHYMRVRRLYRVPEPWSADNGLLTANQKLKRKAIEARYRDAIEQMYR
ncbi:MAG: AMP-dependent synthetase/ligase [Polyangiales bacterium]